MAEALERHLADRAPAACLATYRKTRSVSAEAQGIEMPDEMRDRLRQFLVERLGGRS